MRGLKAPPRRMVAPDFFTVAAIGEHLLPALDGAGAGYERDFLAGAERDLPMCTGGGSAPFFATSL